MEKVLLFNGPSVPARTNQQQLKVIMNLPVRVISDNKVMDILPLVSKKGSNVPFIPRRGYSTFEPFVQPTLNQLIAFSQGCKMDDLVYPHQVALIYQIAIRIVRKWTNRGLFKSYRLNPTMTVFKRSELPTLASIYGSSYEEET